jgi:hypothetical protein
MTGKEPAVRRLVPMVVALLALGSGTPTAAVAHEATQTGSAIATACVAPPLDSTSVSTGQGIPATVGAETASAVALGSEAPLPPRTPPAGTPTNVTVLERIRISEATIAN